MFFLGKKKSFVSFRSHLETRHQERAHRAACSGPVPLWALQPSPPEPWWAVDVRKSFVWLSHGCSVRFLFVHFYFCLFSLPYPCSDPAIPAPEARRWLWGSKEPRLWGLGSWTRLLLAAAAPLTAEGLQPCSWTSATCENG